MSWKASLHRHLGPDVGLGIPAGHFLSRNATPARFCARKLPLLCPSFSLANVNDSGWYHDMSCSKADLRITACPVPSCECDSCPITAGSRLPSRIEGREGLTSGGKSALARPSPESSKGQDISIYREYQVINGTQSGYCTAFCVAERPAQPCQRAKEISEEANQQNHFVTYDQQIEPPHMDAWTISHDASGGEHNPSIHHLENRKRQ
ncbi:hypothetical protein CABS01_12308 [Colletotrichum abscissum]|uniref:uncharacterized protein n=1 Tax=Colletotrichum abscissum TaxID=1671311 RepID=UPI0027D6D14D|nr:uncharacterized protein CABS01_12308 [Colletotrichum abscissum]KAK1490508.1 hypothetical protein CABS01_12308 [Colletotrichum abscissum]